MASTILAPTKPPTAHTVAVNAAFKETLNFQDKDDFQNADKGLLCADEEVKIRNEDGFVVWDLEKYKKYIGDDKDCPDSINPSLYRNAQLCLKNGLYEVIDGIYQVRGYDLSNITFVRGDTGWIVFDPLISGECARAALNLLYRHFQEERPVVAVIYSHSHIDHYGGAWGIISEEDVNSGKIPVIASEGFVEHAVSENVIAGNAMSRRSVYMYGMLLPRDEEGQVCAGLGMTTSRGDSRLIPPTDIIRRTGEERTIDGVTMVFQFTPGSEAPTEINTYFPDRNALWMAENTTCTMHNVLTLRGALVRDALKWAQYITETIDLWGKDSVVKFQAHHWPLWGKENIFNYLKRQRDMYKFIHDQSVRLMNVGYIGSEISEQMILPDELYTDWHCRGYYGTMSHNSRAVYQRYMGWYTGNPSDLNSLPPVKAGPKYVKFMGGEEKVVRMAKESFEEEGDYRWVAMVLRHVVFANPDNVAAKNLLADAYEQMGYQAESGAWRCEYLQGASELRNGVPYRIGSLVSSMAGTQANMDPEMMFDYMGVRVNKDKAKGKRFAVQVEFTDLMKIYTLTLEHSVLSYSPMERTEPADVTLVTKRVVLNQMLMGLLTYEAALEQNLISVCGKEEDLAELFAMLDTPDLMFNIITPHDSDNPFRG